MGNQGKGKRAYGGTPKSKSSRASSAQRRATQATRGQKGLTSRTHHDSRKGRGQNGGGKKKSGGWGVLG
jgi:hypothetical protein